MKKGKTPLFCNKKAIIPIFFVSILWFLYGGKRWIRIRARASVLARIAKRPAPKGGSWRNAPRGVNRAESTIPDIKKKTPHCDVFFLVGRGGFEPPKAVPTDLQSAPFGHSGIFPRLELVVGVEPTTC